MQWRSGTSCKEGGREGGGGHMYSTPPFPFIEPFKIYAIQPCTASMHIDLRSKPHQLWDFSLVLNQ